jgi:multicomponent Na+:H+ antiporter subunit E
MNRQVWGEFVRTVGSAFVLLSLWLLMSGLFKPLIIGFGITSVLIVLLVAKRMDQADGDQVDLKLAPIAFGGYILWLLVEIAKANWAVTKTILSAKMPIRQHLFAVPYTQKTDLGQVIFANSITLTPGTISVEVEPGHFLVHALSYSDGDMQALADMDRRVSAAEKDTAP